jgi:hypothetical protein
VVTKRRLHWQPRHTSSGSNRLSDTSHAFDLRESDRPFQVVWSDQARRDLSSTYANQARHRARTQQRFHFSSPSVLYSCRSEKCLS